MLLLKDEIQTFILVCPKDDQNFIIKKIYTL